MTQYFKGDSTELKMKSVADPLFDVTGLALDNFYSESFDSTAFLLMLYDEKRVPFSERIKRDVFVNFVKETFKNFPVTGTFEIYIFILHSIFGSESGVFFDIPDPGKLDIQINAFANSEFDLIGREFSGGDYTFFELADYDGAILTARGVPGIETEYELNLLFSEIVPAGITPILSLTFFSRFDWVAEESSLFYTMIDYNDNQLIFYEIGG